MAEPRKIFRIEHTAAARLEPQVEATQAELRHAELLRELRALRSALAPTGPQPLRPKAGEPPSTGNLAGGNGGSVARLRSELNLIADAIAGSDTAAADDANAAVKSSQPASASITRLDRELTALVESTEQATQKILAAAEEIDAAAGNLSAALNGKLERGLAEDIQDLVVRIFEACNFQDLAGQRVAKVTATIRFVEDHIARVLDEIKNAGAGAKHNGTQELHGPRLDSDGGHASQDDVDAMFARGGR